MKKIIFLIAPVLMAVAVNGQMNVSVEAGGSIGNSPVAGFFAGYNTKAFNIRAGAQVHLSNKVNQPLLTQIKMGHTFNLGEFYVTPAAGYSHVLKSSDNKELNEHGFLSNVEIGYKFDFKGDAMALYLSGTNVREYNTIVLGIRGFF